jgi:hypothetical protein
MVNCKSSSRLEWPTSSEPTTKGDEEPEPTICLWVDVIIVFYRFDCAVALIFRDVMYFARSQLPFLSGLQFRVGHYELWLGVRSYRYASAQKCGCPVGWSAWREENRSRVVHIDGCRKSIASLAAVQRLCQRRERAAVCKLREKASATDLKPATDVAELERTCLGVAVLIPIDRSTRHNDYYCPVYTPFFGAMVSSVIVLVNDDDSDSRNRVASAPSCSHVRRFVVIS